MLSVDMAYLGTLNYLNILFFNVIENLYSKIALKLYYTKSI